MVIKDIGWRNLGNDGTGTGLIASNIVNGIAGGKAINFNGSDEYITNTSNMIGNGSFTISTWINSNNVSSQTTIFNIYNGTTAILEFATGVQSGKLSIITNNDSWKNGSIVLTTGTWYHVVAIWDGTNIQTYINGIIDVDTADNIPAAGGTRINYLGTFRGSATFFNGIIDKLKIFDKALTNLEVMDLYKKEKGGRR